MHLILTGATGLVGSAVLHHILKLDEVTKLSILSRKPVPSVAELKHVEVILHNDFGRYEPELLEKLKGAHGCVWALGVSQNDVNKEEYVKITLDWPLAAARAFANLDNPFNFVYVSGEGATTTPGMFTMYFGGIKGKAEAALLELSKSSQNLKVYSLRPGGVDPGDLPEIMPKSLNLHRKILFNGLLPVMRTVLPSQTSPTVPLGRILTELAMSKGEPLAGPGVEGEGRTITNAGFRRLAGL